MLCTVEVATYGCVVRRIYGVYSPKSSTVLPLYGPLRQVVVGLVWNGCGGGRQRRSSMDRRRCAWARKYPLTGGVFSRL
jgi:hypothetical protein